MSYRNSSAWIAACVVAALLAACGGGGGGGGGGGLAGFPLPVAGPVTLSGTATYESVPNPSGTLVYASSAPRPVRGAVVEVLNAATSAQLATATTDDNGAYAVSVPANTAIAVRVKAQLVRSGPGASWDVTVRDNTRSGGLYTMQSPTFSSGMVASVRDLHAPSGWGGSSYTGDRVAAPFAILDTVYTAMQKVMSVAPVATFPVLRVFWSPNNAPTRGVINLPAGQIGSTFFVDRGSSGREIYVLGKEDVDTDEYDTSVIAHEWGHYYQSSFSRDDSMGGEHAQGERLDRRLAFSEGWGNAWSGIALGRRNYVDSLGSQQSPVKWVNIDLSAGAATLPGWYSETSIQSIFWNLNQQVGFKPIHDTLTGFQFRSGAAVTSIHPFSAAFNATAPGSASALAALLGGQSINATDNDPFGGAETNDGAIPVAIPMYKVAAVGGGVTRACVSNDAGTGNKLGNFSYVRFNAPANRSYQIVVNGGPAGSNPDFDIFRGGLISRTGNTVSLSAGEYVLAVTDLSSLDACFDVSIQ